ncbi:MAG: AsmA family protein [Gammaproteobacteria bacterium]|nr:AsmA family protein [Gammaproteobacteria bacterium]
MGRPAKIFAWVIAAFLAVFALAAIALTLFFDPNDFREDIASAVQESTGRELRIDGDISVQLFPWLAVEVGHAALGNAEGFGDEPFAEFDEARLSVRILPLLLRQQAEIGTAEISGLRLHFEVDGRGRANWDDLLEAGDGEEASAEPGSAGGSLDISGVDISNASITYAHAQKGDRYELTDVNLSIGRVSSEAEPIPLTGSLHFAVQPGDLSGDIEVETVVAFDRETGVFALDGFSMQGQAEGLVEGPTRMSFETAGMEINSTENTLSIEPLAISVLDIDINAEVETFSYADEIRPTAQVRIEPFSPRGLMHLMEIESPETADPNALSSMSVAAKAYVRENNISLTGLTIELDDTTFTGSMTVPTDGKSRFLLKLSADALDMNRYMAPPSAENGDVPDDTAPVEVPADLIKPLNARGDLEIGTVMIGGLQLDQVSLTLNASGGNLRIHPITAALYGGSYSGDVRIDARAASPVLSMNETVQGVDLAKLARAMFEQDNITGSINGNFKLSGSGNDLGEVQRSLGGSMNFELMDGTYEGTDVWYELRKARALLKQETPPEPVLPARTRFSSVTATGVVTNGIMRNDDLVADLPFMQLTGNGDVNIPAGTVDYSLKARVFEKPEALEEATPEEIEDFTKTVIPLKITGSLSDPKVAPDIEALFRQRVEEEVEDLLKDKLKDIFDR